MLTTWKTVTLHSFSSVYESCECVCICGCKDFNAFVHVCLVSPLFITPPSPPKMGLKSHVADRGKQFSYLNKIILDFSVCLTLLYPFNIRARSSALGERKKERCNL